DSESFRHRFDIWLEEVSERQDIFLGYCSKARDLANQINLYLTREFKVSINDWALDFSAGRSILEEIESAAAISSCGIFLFTNDDQLEGSESQASPRDDVLFEAGYFISAKGRERVLIVRESGSKMPADLGGNIYIHLDDRSKITPIHYEINKFIKK